MGKPRRKCFAKRLKKRGAVGHGQAKTLAKTIFQQLKSDKLCFKAIDRNMKSASKNCLWYLGALDYYGNCLMETAIVLDRMDWLELLFKHKPYLAHYGYTKSYFNA